MARTVQLKEADLLQKHCSEKYSWKKQCGDSVEEMLKMASGMNFFFACIGYTYSGCQSKAMNIFTAI